VNDLAQNLGATGINCNAAMLRLFDSKIESHFRISSMTRDYAWLRQTGRSTASEQHRLSVFRQKDFPRCKKIVTDPLCERAQQIRFAAPFRSRNSEKFNKRGLPRILRIMDSLRLRRFCPAYCSASPRGLSLWRCYEVQKNSKKRLKQ
jgi:hypothetical protein